MNNHQHNDYSVPKFIASEFDNSKRSLMSRFKNIFEDDNKKRGLIVVTVLVIIALFASSLFIFGGKDVVQVNDSLTIYIRGEEEAPGWSYDTPGKNKFYSTTLIDFYKTEYPDVKLNVVNTEDLTDEQFYKKLSSELMAGGGPDVIIGDEKFMQYRDVEKMMRSSSFAELDEFIQSDKQNTFAKENYFDNILEYGRYKGRTYVIPILFDIPIAYASEDVLKKREMNIQNCTSNYLSFVDEAAKYVERNQNGEVDGLFFFGNSISNYMNLMGQTPTYDNPKLNEEQFRFFAERYKVIYPYEANGTPEAETLTYVNAFNNNKVAFYSDLNWMYEDNVIIDNNLSTLVDSHYKFKDTGKPVYIHFNQPDGRLSANITLFAAVNKNSQNKQNGYDFIKLLSGPYISNFTSYSSICTNKLALTYSISKRYTSTIKEYTEDEMSNNITRITDVLDSVDAVYCKSPITYEIHELMLPYYKDEASFEDCFKQVQDKVAIYSTE